MKTLVIDVGGTNVKVLATGQAEPTKIPSGPSLTAQRMAAEVIKATNGWDYQNVSIGFPGPVNRGRITKEPHNLGKGWVRFDFQKAFGKPVKVINDAAMQALGSYEGGTMLFLGLGTGLGAALIHDGTLIPLEIAHLPYKKGKTYEEFLGEKAMHKLGKAKWRKQVGEVADDLMAAFTAEYVVFGGGNSKRLKSLPKRARLGSNANAFKGGFRLWGADQAPK